MDTRQLEYFVAVADEASFSRASVRLFASQSTVSAGIRSLERHLGAPLFDRSSRAVTLTAAGLALLPEARAALESLDRVRSAVARSGAEVRGRLRIGTFIALDAIELPLLLGELHRRHPLVDLQLVASATGSTGLVDDVRHGRADVAFTGLPERELAGLRIREVARSRLVAVLPADHRLAHRDHVVLSDLVEERWIDAPLGYASRAMLDRLLAAEGISRSITAEVADAGEMPKLVAQGLGVAVVPQIIHRPVAGVVAKPLVAADVDFVISLVSRTTRTPATEALFALLDERLASAPRS